MRHGYSGYYLAVLVISIMITVLTAAPVSGQIITTLNILKTGTGTGTVKSSPVGIDCGIHCTKQYLDTTVVTLTAAADPGSAFQGWTGCDTAVGAACGVTMTWDTTITATFELDVTITATQSGTGTGTVTSDPPGISSITTTASSVFPAGIAVTLTATADVGSGFAGWTGCAGTMAANTCTITTTANATINAAFARNSTVTVAKTGNGTGTVSSVPAGIDCGATCSYLFLGGTALELTATAVAGSTFQGWTGCDSGNPGKCFITVSRDITPTAQFGLDATLTVAKTGNGTGTVTSNSGKINCGITCSDVYAPNTVVKLTAAPDSLNVFQGWTGCASASGNTCSITMTADVSVTAQFATGNILSVTKTGYPSGARVYSSPSGISCLSGCSYAEGTFAAGQDVTLYASTDRTADFAYWTKGDCAGITRPTCIVSMTGDLSVGAVFTSAKSHKYNLLVTKTKKNAGDGIVASSDDTINCGPMCRNSYYMGTPISLTASADEGSTFIGWAPASLNCPTTDPCQIAMGSAKTVRAVFVGPQKLVVTKQKIRKGNGTVTSDPTGIILNVSDARAEHHFILNQEVTLTALPDGDSTLTGWKPVSLNCVAPDPCTVTMDKAHTVRAVFAKPPGLGETFVDEDESE